MCFVLLTSAHFLSFLASCSSWLCSSLLYLFFFFSRHHLSSIHLPPPPATRSSVSTLWIIQACRASVFLVVVTSTVTQIHPYACMHVHTWLCQHTRACRSSQTMQTEKNQTLWDRWHSLTKKSRTYRDFTSSPCSTLSVPCCPSAE